MKLFYLKSMQNEFVKQEFYRFITENNEHCFVKRNIYTDTTSDNVYDLFIDEPSDVTWFSTNFEIKNVDTSTTEDESLEFENFLKSHKDLELFEKGGQLSIVFDYVKIKYYQSINKKPPITLSPGELVKLNYTDEDLKAIELGYSGIVKDSPLKKFGSYIDSTFVFIDVLSRNKQMALIQLPGDFIHKEFIVSKEHLVKLKFTGVTI